MIAEPCPNCGARAAFFDQEKGDLICSRCGLVILEKVPRMEYATQIMPRSQQYLPPPPIPDFRGGYAKDWKLGADWTPSRVAILKRVVQTYAEEKRARMVGEIHALGGLLDLPASTRDAIIMRLKKMPIFSNPSAAGKGRPRAPTIAAVATLVCEQMHINRTKKEIMAATNEVVGKVLKKLFRREYYRIKIEWGLGKRVAEFREEFVENLIADSADRLGLRGPIVAVAIETYRTLCKDLKFSSRKPAVKVAHVWMRLVNGGQVKIGKNKTESATIIARTLNIGRTTVLARERSPFKESGRPRSSASLGRKLGM